MVRASAGKARPFLKWAGGKRQLLPQIDQAFPSALKTGQLQRYVEPFVGSGAVFFYVAQTYPVRELFIADINRELILAYRTIQLEVDTLIEALADLQARYLPLRLPDRKDFYYEQRDRYNAERSGINFASFQPAWIVRTAQLIFMNKTCYNGLFRVNARGDFNVPFGRYKNPTICDAANLRAVSAILHRTQISQHGYAACASVIDGHSLVYFDPPYRPLTRSANFTSYVPGNFNDTDQLALATFFRELDRRGAYLLLSNSDPTTTDPDDDFFDAAYRGFHIDRVPASRRINSRAEKRGPINELLIRNY